MITNPNRRIETTVNYDLNMLTPMRDHPFQVRDDIDMEQLMESIREYGVIVPILVRPNPNKDGPAFEIVSGHRRFEARCQAEPVHFRHINVQKQNRVNRSRIWADGQADAIYPILKHIIPDFGNVVFFCYNIGVTTSREVRT